MKIRLIGSNGKEKQKYDEVVKTLECQASD